jgi:hypothetical protein
MPASDTYDGIRTAMQGLWPGEAFGALLDVVRSHSFETIAVWLVDTSAVTLTRDQLSGLFWKDCVGVLDEVSFAHRVVTGLGIGELSGAHLQTPIFYVSATPDGLGDAPAGTLIAPSENWAECVGDTELEQMVAVMIARDQGEPMMEWRRWLERAKDDFHRGFAGPAVVGLQTAMEAFFGDLRTMLLLDASGWPTPPPVEQPLPSFRWLTDSVGRLIGSGNWDRHASSAAFGHYWQTLYRLRNQVIHASYRPTEGELLEAFKAHDSVRDWIAELLLTQPRRFPRTILAFPSESWLIEHGQMTKFLRSQSDYYRSEGRRYWTDSHA